LKERVHKVKALMSEAKLPVMENPSHIVPVRHPPSPRSSSSASASP
jgi:hypothetical protein